MSGNPPLRPGDRVVPTQAAIENRVLRSHRGNTGTVKRVTHSGSIAVVWDGNTSESHCHPDFLDRAP